MELERQPAVLVVAHQAVLRSVNLILAALPAFDVLFYRCLLAYYMETAEEELPWMEVPLHTLIRLEPKAYGCEAEIVKFPVDCVDTHRAGPEVPGFLEER